MHDVQRWLKDLLNEQAGIRLAQLGHSEPMIRDAKREAWWWLKARGAALRKRTRLLSGQAVVWTAPGRVELLRVEVPRARSAEVTVEMLTTVVSPGTERAEYLRLPNTAVSFPFQPGYSGAGRVIAAGADVSKARRGDLVAVRNVAHASIATVRASSVHRVPDGVPPDAAAMVQLGVICSHGVRRADVEQGEPVCVIGSGTVGALAQRIAVAAGAGPVTVIARSHAKEGIARAGGAARFLVVEDDAEEIERLASPVVIEATGDPDALELAVRAAGDGGRIVFLGSPRGVTGDVPVAAIRAKRARVIGAHVSSLGAEGRLLGADMYEREAQAFFDLLASGSLSVAELTETVIDPREADIFYRRLASSRDVVGARFDWTRLRREERAAEGRLLRLPDLTGSGADFERRPLPPGGRQRPVSLYRQRDPFAEASGRLRIGLVGCGEIAVQNARGIAAAPNVELVACYDPVRSLAEDIAATFGGELAPSSEALLEREDVDAVLLAVPHHLHAPLGAEAAAAGKHVIVEKPLANNLKAAVELVDAVDRAGVVLSVCFPLRFQPDVVIARRLIDEGALGEPAGALLNFFMDKPPSYWFGGFSARAHSDWRMSRELAGGGVLIVNLCHYVDLVRHLIGVEADVVTATTAATEEAEVEDVVSVSARYANGALGTFFGTAALRGSAPSEELRLWGPHGQIAIEPRPLVYTLRALDGLVTGRWQTFGPKPRINQRAVYLSRLATAIDRGDSPDVTAQDGLAVQAFIEAAYRSGQSGVAVSPASLIEEVAS